MSAPYIGVTFMDTIRTVELFAGVGGFRLGLEAASDRFKVIWQTNGNRLCESSMLLSATPRISAIKSTMFAKISPKLKSMYLTMICLLEDSRVRTIL